ncbi:c-type cytochrome [Sphingomonas quercus]|uniref:Cytochrome c n=1 Tax=Sphingomonas quercus TaxID=2842451 RepID=A0ABS6BHP6_9SPHN|nr:cytochrome c [Sphingomonas quercus]MBU3077321.1 cytochrome c [Sphingomonas quercus]
MSSRCRARLAALAALALLSACDREERQSRAQPVPETLPTPRQSILQPGVPARTAADPRARAYENNSYQMSQGQLLYQKMNCSGCHAHGGGGMGPALSDAEWRYGGSMEEIVATIDQGRPNGMPSWRGKLTEQQMWQLAAYVRSLSAQPRQDVLSSRPDAPSSTEPATLQSRQPVVPSSPAGVQGTSR